MSVANQWMLSAIVLPGGQITQIVDANYNPGLSEVMEHGSGTVDVEFAAIGEGKPMLSFSSTALATCLGLVGIDGYAIAAETDFYFAKIAQGGFRAGATSHLKLSLSSGMVVPRRISGRQGPQPARISYELYATSSDGVTAPIAIATGQSLPSMTAASEMFTIGPVSINGSALSSIQSIDWDFSPQMEFIGGEGEVYPTFCGGSVRQMTCGLSAVDLALLNTLTLAGTALTSFKTYFRKIAQGGTRVAAATAQHIKLSGTTGMILPRGARGPNNRPLTADWNLVPTFDGTNSTLVVSTASAIT